MPERFLCKGRETMRFRGECVVENVIEREENIDIIYKSHNLFMKYFLGGIKREIAHSTPNPTHPKSSPHSHSDGKEV